MKLVKDLALYLTILALLLFALAVYLAKGWRRQALRAVGFAFIVVGLAVGLARTVGGGVVVDALAKTASVEPAVQDTYDIGTGLLSDGAGAMLFYGVFIVLATWLAGPMGIARSVRRFLAPAMENRAVAYGLMAAILLILFWWSPTEGFQRLPISIVIIVAFVAAFEVLRRQTVREFPDETWDKAGERLRAVISR